MEFSISFPEKSTAEANDLAKNLQNEIQMMGEPVKVKRVRDRADTQDFGATLLLILAAPAVIKGAEHIGPAMEQLAKGAGAAMTELAEGIASWMRRTGSSISVKCGDKVVTVKNTDSANLPGIMAAICGGPAPQP